MSKNKLLIGAMFCISASAVCAQSSTNSPQTRYGLGELSDPIFTHNAAMGGIGYGLRNASQINSLNPAAYSAVDSLSFMFDAGFSLKTSNFSERGNTVNAKNSSLDYIAMQFRVHPRLGISLGYLPYSTVGYNFSFTSPVTNNTDGVTSTNQFSGEGGMQQIYIGAGFKVLKNLSVGLSVGYLNGDITHKQVLSFSDASDQTVKYTTLNINSYLYNIGAQYTYNINKSQSVTIGATGALGHTLGVTETTDNQQISGSTLISTNPTGTKGGYSLPTTFGIGGVWNYSNKWKVGLDYTFQNWANAKHKDETYTYINRHKIAAGAELLPSRTANSYFKRMAYRVGAFYNRPYTKSADGNTMKELGVSFGFGLPLHLYQRNTLLNITGQYVYAKSSLADRLTENRFVVKLGLTFNEHWFMKWKVQ